MGLFGGPDAEKVLAKGTAAGAVLEGILVKYTHDDNNRKPIYHLRVGVAGAGVLGIRQHISGSEAVRLGMPLVVRQLGDAAVIDWPASVAPFGVHAAHALDRWKMMKEPPSAGIVDEEESMHSAAKKGSPASLVVSSIGERSVMFGMGSAIDFDVVVQLPGDEAYAVQLKKVEVPFYAGHLAVVGAQLPCWVNDRRQDKVTIDWPSAAMHNPGVGVSAAALRPEPVVHQPMATPPISDVRGQVDNADAGELIGGISLDTLAAIEVGLIKERVAPADYDAYAQRHGVASGTWAATSAAWQSKLRSDWRIGAKYGELFEAKQKGR
ncbi:MAG: hypothetical protein KAY11_18255 [Ilumatobacteraceae bacterium]|nr:hypothetical protein [Ilumatobacteraceae bacterium]